MGGCCSATPVGPKPVKPQLVRKSSHTGLLNKLALQFPIIKASFARVKLLFADSGDVKEAITADRLGPRLEHVGAKTFSPDEVKRLFNLADLDGSQTISFREFLIAIAHGFYLKEICYPLSLSSYHSLDVISLQMSHMIADMYMVLCSYESDDPRFQEVARGFKIVQKAFQDMDDDHSGTVDAIELKRALFAGASKRDQSVLEARFRELDFNGDGSVTFSEFLFGFAQWVGFEENDDDIDEVKKEETTELDTRSRASMEDGQLATDIIVRSADRPLVSSLKKKGEPSPHKHVRRTSNHKNRPPPPAASSSTQTPLSPPTTAAGDTTLVLPNHAPGGSSSSNAIAPVAADGSSLSPRHRHGNLSSSSPAGKMDRTPSIGTRNKKDKSRKQPAGGDKIQTISIVPG